MLLANVLQCKKLNNVLQGVGCRLSVNNLEREQRVMTGAEASLVECLEMYNSTNASDFGDFTLP